MFIIKKACIALLLPFKIKNKGIAVLVPSLPSKSKRLKSCCLLSIKRLQEWFSSCLLRELDISSKLPPDHQLRELVVCCIRTIKVASRPSRVASGPSISRKCNICCIRTIKVASGSSRVASGPSELPLDHVRKKNSRRRLVPRPC